MFRQEGGPTATPDSASILVIGAPLPLRLELSAALDQFAELTWVDADKLGDGAGNLLRPFDLTILGSDELAEAAEAQLVLLQSLWAERETVVPTIAICGTPQIAERWLAAGVDEVALLPLRPVELRTRIRALQRLGVANSELNNSRRLRAEQTQTLLALLEISTAGAVEESTDEVIERITCAAAQLAFAQRAALLLPAAGGREFIVAEAVGADADVRRRCLPRDRGVAAEAIATGRAVRVRSIGGRSAEAYCLPWSSPGEYVAVPISAGRAADGADFRGVLLVGSPGQGRFSAGTEQALELVGNFAGTAIAGLLSRFWREEARDGLVLALVGLTERRDHDTARHLDRVTAITLLLAEELRGHARFPQIDDSFVRELRRAVPLHDIGKVAIPDSILLKPGRLTDAEMQVMRTHAAIGADAIASVRARMPGSTFARIAEEIARHHHEWYDGSGYPDRLAGPAIPLAARIVAVADVYDALTSRRIYKPPVTHEAACDIIRHGIGTQFDPIIGEALLRREADVRRLAEALSDEAATIDPSIQSIMPMDWILRHTPRPFEFLDSTGA